MVEFSDEEGYDLYKCYNKFVHLKVMECVDYTFNIQSFDQLYDIAKQRKGTDYKQYIRMNLDYLYGFPSRVKPLLDLNV